MKKNTLLAIFMLINITLTAQVSIDNFEQSSNTWNNVSCLTEIRANAYKTGINTSNTVLYTTRATTCDNWSGAIYNLSSAITGYKYAHIKMYRNNSNVPNLKVSDNPAQDITPMNTIVPNQWQDVVFDISAYETSGISFIMLMVDRSTTLSEDAWMLCDAILLSNDATPNTTDEPISSSNNDEIGTGETNGYQTVWADYFNSGVFNTDDWNTEVNGNGGGNNELQYYRAENVSVGTEPITQKGCLIITAKKESYLGKSATSGRVTTKDKISFKHGKIEASIKLPNTANGLWPAFWMLGSDIDINSWPTCGEIDIMEMGNANAISAGTQDRYFNGACHWGVYTNGNYPNYGKSTTNTYSLQDDFHLFTLYWDDNNIKMYLDQDKYPDASPYYQMGIDGYDSESSPGLYFHKQFFVLFNLAIGGNFPGIWDINSITALSDRDANMYVNFVKIYQKGTSDEEYGGPTILSDITTEKTFQLYPNPVQDIILLSKKAIKVNLVDLSGHIILQATNISELDLSNYQSGMYLLQIEDCDGHIETHKVIKQ